MAFKIKEGLTIGSTSVFNDSAVLQVNAPTASKWLTARTLTVTGDASGSVQIDGGANAELALTITGLEGGEFTGNLTGDVKSTNGTTVLDSGTDGSDATFTGDVIGDVTGDLFGNADTASTWLAPVDLTVALTGDVAGTVTQSVDGSGNVTFSVATTVQANSVALGDDTTGNYVADVSVTAGTGLSVSGTGEGASVVLAGLDATTTTKGVASFDAADFGVTSGVVTLDDTVVKGLTVDGDTVVTPSDHSVQIAGGEGIDVTATGSVITVTGELATSSNKGVASFDADNFLVTDGVVTIKDGGVANVELANSSVTIGSDEVSLGGTITDLNGLTSVDVDNITIDGNTISTSSGDLTLSPTGDVNVSNNKITSLATPTSANDAATKQYVDTIASASLHYHDPVRVESPVALSGTYDNGAGTITGAQEVLAIDGVTLDLGDRVLLYKQGDAVENGVYEVSTVGVVGATAWVLTRTADTDSYGPSDPAALGTGDAFYVKEGDTGAGELYVMTTEGTITFGTTDIIFSQISSAQIYSGGDGLDLTGTVFSVNVDDSTIEINGDALRVKDLGITAAKLAADAVTTAKILDLNVTNAKLANSTITVTGDSGTQAIDLGDTLTITGSDPVQTSQSGDTLTISVDDATTTTKGIASFATTDFNVSSGAVELKDTVLKAITTDTGALSIAGHGISIVGGQSVAVTHVGTTITVASDIASTDNAGVASFSSDNFAVNGSGVVTIKADGVILGTETSGDYVASLVAGTAITITNNSGETATPTIELDHLGIEDLADPDADRIMFWDDSAGKAEWLEVGTGLSITGTTLANTQQAFQTISVSGQSDVVADAVNDTLTFAAGDGISITTDAGADTVTITNTALTGGNVFTETKAQVTGGSTGVVATLNGTAVRSAKLFIQIDDGTNYQASEVLLVHSGAAIDIIEYGVVEVGTPMGDVSAAYNGTDIQVSFANASATQANVVIKYLAIADYA